MIDWLINPTFARERKLSEGEGEGEGEGEKRGERELLPFSQSFPARLQRPQHAQGACLQTNCTSICDSSYSEYVSVQCCIFFFII